MSDSFAKKIRNRRIERGLTLEELANRLGTSKNYVWQLENKAPARPSGQLLLKLASVLELSPDFLINDEANEQDTEHLKDVVWRKSKSANLSKADLEKVLDLIDIIKKDQA